MTVPFSSFNLWQGKEFELTLQVLQPVLTRGADALVRGIVATCFSILISISLDKHLRERMGVSAF